MRGCRADDADLTVQVLLSWSTVHGFALLSAGRTLDGKVDALGDHVLFDGVIAGALRAALG